METPIPPSLLHTDDLSIFKLRIPNRGIAEKHVRSFVKTLSQAPLFHIHPILVNKSLQVLDGQHRLEAPRRLGISVFYAVVEGDEDWIVTSTNANQMGWSIEDWVKFYADRGNEDYQYLLEASLRFKCSCSETLTLFCGGFTKREDRKNFKMGLFKIGTPRERSLFEDTMEGVVAFQKRIHAISLNRLNFLYSARCRMALFLLIRHPELVLDEFIEKCSLKIQNLRACTSGAAYREMFLEIYNFARRTGRIENNYQTAYSHKNTSKKWREG